MNVASSWNIDVCRGNCFSVWRVGEGVVASFLITAALNSARCGIPVRKERVLEYSRAAPALPPSFFLPLWIVVLFFIDMTYYCLKGDCLQVDYSIDFHWLLLLSKDCLCEPCKAFARVSEYWVDHILRVLYSFFVLASKRIPKLEPLERRP